MTAPVQEKKSEKKPIPLRPFKTGAQSVDDEPFERQVTLTASSQPLDQYNIPSSAYLQEVEIHVTGTTAGNSASAAFKEDGVFRVIDTLNFLDTGNSEIITQITGWDLYIINKFGGYKFSDDPKASPVYSATTGTGATGGSFEFLLRVPVELVPRDALGPLPNKSNSTPFKIKTTVAPSAAIYSTPPTAAPTVMFRFTPVSYWEPTADDGSGNPVSRQPPAMNTTAFWNVTPYNWNAGPFTQQLDNATGYPIRNLIFVLRGSDGTRSAGEANWPSPFKIQMQSNMVVNRLRANFRDRIAKDYGYDSVGDTKNGKDNGVYVIPFCRDFFPKPGWENRRSYLRTTDGMRLEAKGAFGGSGAQLFTVFVNYVSPAAGVSLAQITT